jgi:hypothetical protein
MSCKNTCKICDRLVLSQSITFDGTNLVVNLPAGSYNDGEKYCVILAQTIPTTTTIGANVVFTIGAGTVQYQLVNRCCRPVTACGIRTRYKYSLCVQTTPTTAVFKMLGEPFCAPNNNLTAIDGTAPTVAGA